MSRLLAHVFLRAAALCLVLSVRGAEGPPKRIVILKIDGLNADLLYGAMHEQDPATGKSVLPWFEYIFGQNGTVFRNFYTRGISLSAPSWSMLDTGEHAIIRGNAEYDRYTGQVYDYLNFFPFYIGYARHRTLNMPGVDVLDRAGIPLMIDRFAHEQVYQSFQLFQRGVRWKTLKDALERKFSSRALISIIESGAAPSWESELERQTEAELERNLMRPEVLYLDLFTGDIDHEGHATSNPAALLATLKRIDSLCGRIWTIAKKSPLAASTIFAVVSDHGMNNVPGIVSQTYSLVDLFSSREGGAHHVITNRVQLSDYKLRGLNPLVRRVITPSPASFYLKDQQDAYPTAWLDIDGNERAAVHLRNSNLNRLHILLLALARPDLKPELRAAIAGYTARLLDARREIWQQELSRLARDTAALKEAALLRKRMIEQRSAQRSTETPAVHHEEIELQAWESELADYSRYIAHLKALLAFQPDPSHPLAQKISALIPEMSLGDNNSVYDLQHYIVGPGPLGVVLGSNGALDEEASFRRANYFELLASQRVRNNPQPRLSPNPIDFAMMALPDANGQHRYWLYSDDAHQLLILTNQAGQIAVQPVRGLTQDQNGNITWTDCSWGPGLPLKLFEDPSLALPPEADRASWLSTFHTEREWFNAIYNCQYSNGVIGVTEELQPIDPLVPGPPNSSPDLLDYERLRRELVQADFHVFAADHWNFNTRFPNPGGNHGSFLRISTHSVWMLAGAGIPEKTIEEPYDSLNFASTILNLLGRPAPMEDRIVRLQ